CYRILFITSLLPRRVSTTFASIVLCHCSFSFALPNLCSSGLPPRWGLLSLRVLVWFRSEQYVLIVSFCALEPSLICGKASPQIRERKSTRLNSSHVAISYAVFCLKKKKKPVMKIYKLQYI